MMNAKERVDTATGSMSVHFLSFLGRVFKQHLISGGVPEEICHSQTTFVRELERENSCLINRKTLILAFPVKNITIDDTATH